MAVVLAALCGATAVSESGTAAAPEAFGKHYECKPGPWGRLSYYYFQVEMPDGLVNLVSRPDPVPRWSFPGGTEASLRALFESAGLSSALQKFLLDPKNQVLNDKVLTVFPPVADMLAMTREQRTIIYRELAKSEINVFQYNPSHITNGDPESWFARSGLRAELLDTIKQLTYMRGEVLCFCDLGVLFGMVQSEEEARQVVRAASRTSSLVLHLDVKGQKNLKDVVEYWSGRQRNRDVEGTLYTAAATEGIDNVDCIHLLPPLPRRYLHNYYLDELSIFGGVPDCNWSSLNFFNLTPVDYSRDPRLATLHVAEDYVRVEPPYQFGDVLMFVTATGLQVHSCVYVADDIVYTKNGRTVSTPWTLNKIGDLRRLYSYEQTFNIQGYRLKAKVGELRN